MSKGWIIDVRHESWRMRLALLAVMLFAVGCYFAYDEFDYLIRGKQTTARVLAAAPDAKGRRLRVGFAFAESNGTQRKGVDWEAANWAPPADHQVRIDYTPGENGRARFAGNVKWIGLLLFFGSLGLFGLLAVRLALESIAATRPPKKKRRGRPDSERRDY